MSTEWLERSEARLDEHGVDYGQLLALVRATQPPRPGWWDDGHEHDLHLPPEAITDRDGNPGTASRSRWAVALYAEMDMPKVRLRPFEREQLPLVEPWFEDADTQRWLGGPSWPRLALDLADRPLGEFRGATETGRYRWLAWDRDEPVGYIDCGTTGRWTTWEGGANGRGVVATIPVPSASVAYVVDPAVRRRGYGSAMIVELLALPDLAHVELFGAGVEPDNTGSVGCIRAAGFEALDPRPDWEGIVYYVKRRRSAEGQRSPARAFS